MGGSPRSKLKPLPSYEQGRLRDETVAERQDETYNSAQLEELLKKAATAAESD